jgi:hypothetical protein
MPEWFVTLASSATLPPKTGRFTILLLVVVALFAAPLLAAEQPDAFVKNGHRYTFTAEFVVKATLDQVMDVLYPFPDLRGYSRTASAVDLVDEGTNWQLVRFTYATWLWSISTTFRREIDRPNHRILFRMVDARRTGLPVPLPTASSGEYLLEPFDGGVRVTYVQMAETRDTLLSGPWMSRAHAEAIQFSEDLERYVRSNLPRT